jgi:hypothetical protein
MKPPMTTTTPGHSTPTLYVPSIGGGRNPNRTPLFKKSPRQNQEFERFLLQGQESTLLDATRSKYIPVSYFTTTTATAIATESVLGGGGRQLRQLGKADTMPYESFKLINLQKPGKNAHSLILIKSRTIKTNPANISVFECNGQYTQSEIRVVIPKRSSVVVDVDRGEEPTTEDVTSQYLSPISPKLCINYGNDTYNPGYCGIFGIICMIFFRHYNTSKRGGGPAIETAAANPERWLRKWKIMLDYMSQDIPDEPDSHGCLGVSLAAKVQQIIAAATPSSSTAFESAEKEIVREIKRALKSFKPKQ